MILSLFFYFPFLCRSPISSSSCWSLSLVRRSPGGTDTDLRRCLKYLATFLPNILPHDVNSDTGTGPILRKSITTWLNVRRQKTTLLWWLRWQINTSSMILAVSGFLFVFSIFPISSLVAEKKSVECFPILVFEQLDLDTAC